MSNYLRLYGSRLRFAEKSEADAFFEDEGESTQKIQLAFEGTQFWGQGPSRWMQNHDFPKTVPDYRYLVDGGRFGAIQTPYRSVRRAVPGEDGVAIVVQIDGQTAVAAHMTHDCARSFARHLMRLASPDERAAEQQQIADGAMAKWSAADRGPQEPDDGR